jgi:hypothetical protein
MSPKATEGAVLRRMSVRLVRLTAAALAITAVASAQTVTFSPIAISGDPLPLGPGNFKTMSMPAIDQGFVAFEATSTTDPTYRSIFRSNGFLVTRIAETFTPMPGAPSSFFSAFGWGSTAGQLSVDGVFVTFVGRDVPGSTAGPLEGIYTGLSPAPAIVFDSTPANGGFVNYGIAGEPSRDGSKVVTTANISGKGSIGVAMRDLSNGSLTWIKSAGEDLPGSAGAATNFGASWIRNGRVVYVASASGTIGVYVRDLTSGAESVIADTTMNMPGSSTFFNGFATPVIDEDGNVAFHGQGTGRVGFYRRLVAGAVEKIVDTHTEVPGTGGSLFSFLPQGMISIDDGAVVFSGIAGSQGWSIYRANDDGLSLVVKKGDVLENGTVNIAQVGRQALDGDIVAFRAVSLFGLEMVATALLSQPDAADVDRDGVVGPVDLSVVLGGWGPCTGQPCAGDVDGDGSVGASDIALLLGSWSGAPINDEPSGALPISYGAHAFSTTFATNSSAPLAGNFAICDEGDGDLFERDIWFRVAACGTVDDQDSIMTVSTCGTVDYDSRIAIYRDDPKDGLVLVSCSDNAVGCGQGSSANWIANTYFDYVIRVGGGPGGPASGSGTLLVGCAPASDNIQIEGDGPERPLFPSTSATANWQPFIPASPSAWTPSSYQPSGCGPVDATDFWCAITGVQTGLARLETCEYAGTVPYSLTLYRNFEWGTPFLCDEPVASCNNALNEPVQLEWVSRPGELYFVRIAFPTQPPVSSVIRGALSGDQCADRSCFASHDLIGCESTECCGLVCASDPFCCSFQWDEVCAGVATNLCEPPPPTCGAFSSVSCYLVDLFPGCSDADCCAAVCALDLVCCDVAWDLECVDQAIDVCIPPTCPVESEATCFESHIGPGCNDAVCCGRVCDADPACCDVTWDGFCAFLASTVCEP